MINLEGKDFFRTKDNFESFESVNSTLLYGNRLERPKVSIMIPTFLRNGYLAETIDSALNQDSPVEYEIVVVDNNPEMEDTSTLKLIQQYDANRVAYYKNAKNLGMFGNWNRCLQLANAEWVLILHDDDTITPDYISYMLCEVNKHKDLSCVGCSYTLIDGDSQIIPQPNKSKKWQLAEKYLTRNSFEVKTKDFFFIHPINIMGLFVNKEKALEIGGFDNTWDPTSDYIFILNLADRNRVRCTEKKLLNYRQAVNASLSQKHLLGMVEVDAYMRKDINRHLKVMDEKKALLFRSAHIINHEMGLLKNWTSSLTQEQLKAVKDEYLEFNKVFKIKKVSDTYCEQVIKKQGYYQFWMKYIRR